MQGRRVKTPTETPTPEVRTTTKPGSPKFPVTSNAKSNTDGEGKIISAEFVDTNGNRLHSSKVGKTVVMKITAKEMKKMIKQFQKDYMKVSETGKVCGNVLRAIDEFQSKFTIDFTEIKCKCKICSGFGDGSNNEKYLKGNLEAHHRYEYPGIHRSLLSSIRSVTFYLAKDGRYSFNKVNSGYRFHPEY